MMEEYACTWALPYLEEQGQGKYPFKGVWVSFEQAFTKQFMPLDTRKVECEVLKKIKQGKDSMAEYQSKFDQYTMQTGWSDEDHCTHFYNGLNEKLKDNLAITDCPIAKFDNLKHAAQVLDQCICQCEAEKKGQKFSNTSQWTSTKNPDAMEVDATH